MKKAFDCVEMKNRRQAELRDQEQGLGAEEIRKRRQQWLARGEDSLARWWRAVGAETLSPVVREEPPPDGGRHGKGSKGSTP